MGENEFSWLGDHKKVVDNEEKYLNMQFEACIYSTSHENEEKVIFLIRNRSFSDLTAVNMQKSSYSPYKNCR